MTLKYEVYNRLTGLPEEAPDFESAKILRDRLMAEYIEAVVRPAFRAITVLVQLEDGSWKQTLADENGQPVVRDDFAD